MRPVMHAFIDESGQRAFTRRSSPCFVMSAALVADADLPRAGQLLAELREATSRAPSHELHWNRLRPEHRARAAAIVARTGWLTFSTAVLCKRHLDFATWSEHETYLRTFRILLERLSWFARERESDVHYTLASVHRFPVSKLRAFEHVLRTRQTEIAWDHVPKPGRVDQPSRNELLQLADFAASIAGEAFNGGDARPSDPTHLRTVAGRLYRRGRGPRALLSYGLKLYPSSDAALESYPWLAGLG
ncbi:MAG: DUF3800 domain-containing protein [Kofleriaceae bacterium]|nr:DUF3800 domain-containing protein [Kofleriaceae bacterium]